MRPIALSLLTAGLMLGAAPVAAQHSCETTAHCGAIVSASTPVSGALTIAGINAVLGGVTSAGMRVIRGEPLAQTWDAFLTGAVGGGMVYAGKHVAVERFDGAGFLGREIASVGGSIVRNASAGRGALEELVLPVGPVRLYIGNGSVVPRLDVATLVTSGIFMVAHDARFDAGASLSSGAVVFRGDSPMPGLSSAGVTLTWSDLPASEGPRLLAHERVHILQYDQAFLSWGEDLERWAARQVPQLDGGFRHIDLGASALGIRTGLAMALGYHDRPWEREAYFLAQRAYPVGPAGIGH